MLKPSFTKPHVLVCERISSNRRYGVVFFSRSVRRATKLASLLSLAGIRVHHASTSAEVKILLKITSAGVVLLDLQTIGSYREILRVLAGDFPEACAIVLSPIGLDTSAQLYAEGSWEVVVEPARLLDLLAALESAHELNRELTDPVRSQSRVDAILKALTT